MIDVFKEGLFKVTKKYSNIAMLYGDDLFAGEDFFKFFADRSFNLGAGQQNMVGSACGFVVRGKMPIIFSGASLSVSAAAQIRDNICIPNLNVKFVVAGGKDFFDLEIMKLMPNIKIMAPKNDEELLMNLDEMVEVYGPVYFRLGLF